MSPRTSTTAPTALSCEQRRRALPGLADRLERWACRVEHEDGRLVLHDVHRDDEANIVAALPDGYAADWATRGEEAVLVVDVQQPTFEALREAAAHEEG